MNISIGVLGAGSWGMALARMLAVNGHSVTVWSALAEEVEEYSSTRVMKRLGNMQIPDDMVFTTDIAEAVCGKELILFAVPSVFVRKTAAAARAFITPGQVIVDVAKGIESDTLLTMSQVIADELHKDESLATVLPVALSGPTHAEEVAFDLPTTIVSACEDMALAEYVQDVFTTPSMRVYTNTDVVGVELCGALKNIIALASGISTGLGYGDNARAAIITRGAAEIARLGVCMGSNIQTIAGLAGIGDLIVTAMSRHSRNNRAGMLIGGGSTPQEAVKAVGMVVEGINALPAAVALANKYGVEMPIVFGVDAVINHGADPAEIVRELMGRTKKAE